MTLTQHIHAALVDLKNNPPRSCLGICFHVDVRMGRANVRGHDSLINDAFSAWPKYSGLKAWPVPCPQGNDPEQAYSLAGKSVMWNPEHPYGALRLELLDFMIEHFGATL